MRIFFHSSSFNNEPAQKHDESCKSLSLEHFPSFSLLFLHWEISSKERTHEMCVTWFRCMTQVQQELFFFYEWNSYSSTRLSGGWWKVLVFHMIFFIFHSLLVLLLILKQIVWVISLSWYRFSAEIAATCCIPFKRF